nr:zinc finger, CCHC-type [Tanacetum cinerariifolium]
MTNEESMKDMTSKFDKLAKFEGQDFHRWQKKMHFLLTTLNVMYVLSTPSAIWSENETLEMTRKRIKWENDDYIFHVHILNGMSDSLVDIYQNAKSTKALWESLESKYMAEDAFATKFLTSHVKKDCRLRKGNDGAVSNGPKDLEKKQGYNYDFVQNFVNVLHYVSVISDAFYVQDDEVAWFYILETNVYVSVNSIIESKDAIFDEERFTSIPRSRCMIQPSLSKIAEDEVAGTDDAPGPSVPRKSTRTRKAKSFRNSTIRLFLALAAIHDQVIHQMDVKTTFLNGDLDEEIYMKQHEGFVMPGHESKTKEFLSSKFDIKDLREAEVILGIRIKRGNNDPTVKFRHNKGTPVSQLEYVRAIGCLMYAMISTRPDIAFAVGKLSWYTRNLSALYWQALGRVFHYLKGTMDYGLTYSGNPFVIECYSDASWINNMEDHSSTSGWVFLLGRGAISWASKKQTCITSSTIESEFVALATASNEAEWLRNLVYEIPLWLKPISIISIRCDSATILAKAYSQVYNADHLIKGLARDLARKETIGMVLKST